MAKHSVPKKKTSKGRTTRRYKAFQAQARKKLNNRVNLFDCPKCFEKVLIHHVCKNCGTYRGRQVFDMTKKIEKITKVKA